MKISTASSRKYWAALAVISLGSLAPIAWAAPAPAEAPTVLRRTALIVADMDASLKFYRDALGLVMMDDRTHRSPETAKSDAEANSVTRLILFRSKDDYVGQLELIHMGKPGALPPAPSAEPHLGHFAILFTTQDVMATFAKVKAVPGVKVAEAPHLKTYPTYSGSGTTTDWFCSVYDPDGNFVEINHPAG